MKSSGPHPPAVASWLVELFASDGQAESLAGDLCEEFLVREPEFGIASARRWYWRQSVRTAADLLLAGLRDSPGLIGFSLLTGCLLLPFGIALPERIIAAVIHYREHGVIGAWMRWDHFWFQTGSIGGRLAVALLAGAMAAKLSKGRAMLGGITPAMAWTFFMAVARLSWIVRFWPESLSLWVISFLPVTVAVAAGAAIVRARTVNRAHLLLRAG